MVTVTRMYQLGGSSTFEARDQAHLLSILSSDELDRRMSGDCQGVAYSVATPHDARAIGGYETVDGAWVIEGTDIVVLVDEEKDEDVDSNEID